MATRYVYLTGGREVTLDDAEDQYTPQQIKDHWAATFPELSAATWDTKEADGVKVVTFAKKVGTKGAFEQHLPKLDGVHLIIRQDQLCPICEDAVLIKAPDHLYCPQCEKMFDLPVDQELRRMKMPTLPGLEATQ